MSIYKRGWLKVGTCKAPGCCNLLPPRKGRGNPPVTCSPECKKSYERERAREARGFAKRQVQIVEGVPCSNVPCTCGRDYLTLPL
jgi:hypothetical protein